MKLSQVYCLHLKLHVITTYKSRRKRLRKGRKEGETWEREAGEGRREGKK